jgi:transposase
MAKRVVGIDLGKTTMEVCILEGQNKERKTLRTDAKGRKALMMLLRKSDRVGMEMCCCAAMLTREIRREVGCVVYDLNAGALRIIWKSRKKTDKEDSLKIAKYIRDTPVEEMVTVELPGKEEEAFRADISMKTFLKKERTAAINRLHSLYAREGITDVTKKDLKGAEGRSKRRSELTLEMQQVAVVLEEQLEMFEKQIAVAEEKVNTRTREHELAPYVMSIPGIGIGLAAPLLAYIGDGSRFSKASQVAYYAGLTPSVDSSGQTDRYGSIAKYQYCAAIRGVIIEGVWALIRSGKGGELLANYKSLCGRIGKKKSAVAIARKMVTLAWLLLRRRELYRGIDAETFRRKMMFYKNRPEKWEALLPKLSSVTKRMSCPADLAKDAAQGA